MHRVSERRRLLVIADRVHAPGMPATDAAQAVLIENDRVGAVGPADALRRAHPDAESIELPGTVITPGLCDAHIHLTEWALARRAVDLTAAESPAAAAAEVARAAAGRGPDEWLRGHGWNPHRWRDEAPHRTLLDQAAPGRAVALQSHDMHALWASSPALERAGIGADTPDPDGGRIVRDPDGTPTGLLLENAARLVIAAVPAPGLRSVCDVVLDAQSALHRLGVTAVHSFPGIHVPEPDPLPVLESLRAEDRLRLRVLQHIRLERLDHAIAVGLRSGFGGDWIRIGGVKMFLDGALGSRTAWMRAPYVGEAHCGIRVLDTPDFRDAVRQAAEHGIATTVHAIGDAAVALAFTVLSDEALRVAALPHRVEHVQCCPDDVLEVPGRAGIVCSVQPCHLITDWRVADRHWGADRAARTYAFASLLRHGAVLAFGSDAPVEPADPRLGLHAATSRTDLDGQPDGGWNDRERIDAATAFAAYTRGPAFAAGLDGRLGTLRPGAFADLVAWQGDPLDLTQRGALDLQCAATFVGGHIVHS